MNYLSRDVSVLDLGDGRDPAAPLGLREIGRIPLVAETLPADVLRGKVLFNNANDPRLSRNGWLSCATCHLDGGVDGITWPREEGSRQTMPLWSLAGTAPFHDVAAVVRGRAVFEGRGCQSCHAGPSWTTSSLPGEPSPTHDLEDLVAFLLSIDAASEPFPVP